MKGGKKRNSNTDPAQPPPPDDAAAAAASAGDGGYFVRDERRQNPEDGEKFEAALEVFEEEEGEDEDFSEGEREYEQLENVQVEEAEAAEGERTKLADGYYEIEAVRRKRVRKGKVQYLIKWRGWSEAANTWEPFQNLLQCSDIIDAFEESLKGGKSKSTRKRKRKTSVTHVQTKKKQHQHPQQQQRSPAAATYNVPSHVIRIADGPIPFPRLNDFTCINKNGETNINNTNSVETSKKVNETREEEKEQNELNLKICELKGAMVITNEDTNRLAITSQEGQSTVDNNILANELKKTDGVDQIQSGRCTGAKKRKSGSVKRFKKDPASCSVDDASNGASLVPVSVQCSDFLGNNANCRDRFEDSKSMCTITQIIKPISYKASISNNVHDVLVAFEAVRSDGTKVIVDNKFLKANNPLLLIDFYEKNLRYSPT